MRENIENLILCKQHLPACHFQSTEIKKQEIVVTK